MNNKIYIGSAVDFYLRFKKHISDLRRDKHDNKHLQRAWNKYGENNFKFEIVEIINDKNKLIEREQYYMDSLNVCDKNIGYNISPTANSRLGVKVSQETLIKMSNSQKGLKRPISEETKKKISEGNSGKVRSKEAKEKYSKAKKGIKFGERTQEVKDKISKANTGRIREDMRIGNNSNCLLTEEQVYNLKIDLSNGIHPTDLLKKYKVSLYYIYDIANKRKFKYILPNLDMNFERKLGREKLNKEKVKQIRNMLKNNISTIELAEIFKVSEATIKDIKNFRTWKNVV